MIIHLPVTLSEQRARDLANSIEALYLRRPDAHVLLTNCTIQTLPPALEGIAEAWWAMPTDMQLSSRTYHPDTYRIDIGDTYIGGDGRNQLMIAGPCAVESREQIEQSCRMLVSLGIRVLRAGCYKPRTSPYTFRGLGEDGLKLLAEMRDKYGLLIATEMRDASHADKVIQYADICLLYTSPSPRD